MRSRGIPSKRSGSVAAPPLLREMPARAAHSWLTPEASRRESAEGKDLRRLSCSLLRKPACVIAKGERRSGPAGNRNDYVCYGLRIAADHDRRRNRRYTRQARIGSAYPDVIPPMEMTSLDDLRIFVASKV